MAQDRIPCSILRIYLALLNSLLPRLFLILLSFQFINLLSCIIELLFVVSILLRFLLGLLDLQFGFLSFDEIGQSIFNIISVNLHYLLANRMQSFGIKQGSSFSHLIKFLFEGYRFLFVL